MARTIKSKPKLVDLFMDWRDAEKKALLAAGRMSITPALMKAERDAYNKLFERLLECKC